MSDYEIDFNVYDGTSGSFGDTSYTDHMNVTFRSSSTDFSATYGVSAEGTPGAGAVIRGIGESNDGVVLDEAQNGATFANDIYEATGHPGQVGDLFTVTDMLQAPGVIWAGMPGFDYWDVVPYAPTECPVHANMHSGS